MLQKNVIYDNSYEAREQNYKDVVQQVIDEPQAEYNLAFTGPLATGSLFDGTVPSELAARLLIDLRAKDVEKAVDTLNTEMPDFFRNHEDELLEAVQCNSEIDEQFYEDQLQDLENQLITYYGISACDRHGAFEPVKFLAFGNGATYDRKSVWNIAECSSAEDVVRMLCQNTDASVQITMDVTDTKPFLTVRYASHDVPTGTEFTLVPQTTAQEAMKHPEVQDVIAGICSVGYDEDMRDFFGEEHFVDLEPMKRMTGIVLGAGPFNAWGQVVLKEKDTDRFIVGIRTRDFDGFSPSGSFPKKGDEIEVTRSKDGRKVYPKQVNERSNSIAD